LKGAALISSAKAPMVAGKGTDGRGIRLPREPKHGFEHGLSGHGIGLGKMSRDRGGQCVPGTGGVISFHRRFDCCGFGLA
jgi:hypothetical protein